MAKDLRTFIAECERRLPGEVIHITKEVNPANYDVTAIIKHLGAQKKFPIIISDFAVQVQCFVEDNDGKFLLRAKVFNDRGYIVICRIDFFGNMNDFARQSTLALCNKSPEILSHAGLLDNIMKNFMQKDLSDVL